MALIPGTRLGPYEVVAQIGVGGMGEVYRATDTNLKRAVAIKVLPASLAADAERLARFQREAEVLAALNHPNIAAIYGLERSSDTTALVMELVEGDDLSQRIAGGAIPLDEALPIAKEIADALEAAHEQGIIHRDLKPANIKVRADGVVKVLDFGLAKAMEPAAGSSPSISISPTLTTPAMTQAGMILGTVAYMSPEQAKGKAADKRSDIWAFGCVLYEMLTGRRAFEGDDVSDTLASVLKSEPDWNALPTATPASVRAFVRRCLAKDRKQRLADISTLRFVLDASSELGEPVSVVAMATPVAGTSATGLKALVALLATILLAGLAWIYLSRRTAAPVTRFFVTSPEKTTFVTNATIATSVAISPDGRTLAFTARDAAGKTLLWVRPIDSLTAQPLPGTDEAAFPFWSPDSRFIAYMAPRKLLKIAATGGPPQLLCALNSNMGRGGAWSRDGVIVFNGAPGGLLRVPSAGGQSAPLTKDAGNFPSFLPDGRHVLFHRNNIGSEGPSVYVTSLDGDEPRRLVSADSGAVYARSGHLLFVRQGTLLAQSFNLKTLTLSDEPFPIAEHVESSVFPGLQAFSVSDTGTLAYGIGLAAAAGLRLTWIDRRGKSVGTIGSTENYRGIELSPDGARLAAQRHEGNGGDIWVTDLSRDTTSRFTFDASQSNYSPIWSPDGTQIAFASLRGGKWGLYRKPSNGAGTEERLYESERQVAPESWSPDGRTIVYYFGDPKTASDLWMLALSDRKPSPLVHTPFVEYNGQISPDGKWLAYQSNETGRNEVYVRPFPSGGGQWQVSTSGGAWPRWRRDGRELFYIGVQSFGKLMAIDVRANGPTFDAGTPRELFESGYVNLQGSGPYPTYAVAADGQRFLIPRSVSASTADTISPIAVVLNLQAALGARERP